MIDHTFNQGLSGLEKVVYLASYTDNPVCEIVLPVCIHVHVYIHVHAKPDE